VVQPRFEAPVAPHLIGLDKFQINMFNTAFSLVGSILKSENFKTLLLHIQIYLQKGFNGINTLYNSFRHW